MRITVIGLGYVGLANLAVLAETPGIEAVGYDNDFGKIAALKEDAFPFDERTLADSLAASKPLFTSDSAQALVGSSAFFVTVGTPSLKDGNTDLSYFYDSLTLIRRFAKKGAFVVIRSTVPVGTAASAATFLNKTPLSGIEVVSFPEFLAEGTSYADEKKPSRLVVGASSARSSALIRSLKSEAIQSGVPLLEMSNESAELSKYAANAFLATKISFINEMARLAEKDGADILDVAAALGTDPRIGKGMLKPGIGYGGSCFSKDVASLLNQSSALGTTLLLTESTAAINHTQPLYFLKKIEKHTPLSKARIALLGLSYKAGISDIRNSLSLTLAAYLLEEGAIVSAYDVSPEARKDFKERLPKVETASSIESAIKGADAIVILTEELLHASLDEAVLAKLMKGRAIYDAKNLYPLGHFKEFDYYSIGRRDDIKGK